jgi:cytoskeletal protein RodZ
MAQSTLPTVDLAQAVIDSYADRALPGVTDLSPPRLPRTDRWINLLWLIVIFGILGFLAVLVFHFGSNRNNPTLPDMVGGTPNVQSSNNSLQGK